MTEQDLEQGHIAEGVTAEDLDQEGRAEAEEVAIAETPSPELRQILQADAEVKSALLEERQHKEFMQTAAALNAKRLEVKAAIQANGLGAHIEAARKYPEVLALSKGPHDLEGQTKVAAVLAAIELWSSKPTSSPSN